MILATATIIYLASSSRSNDKDQNINNENEIKTNAKTINDVDLNKLIDIIKENNLFALKYYNGVLDFKENHLSEPMVEVLYAYVSIHGDLVGDSINNYFENLYNFIPDERKPLICPLDNKVLLSYDDSNLRYHINKDHPGHGGKVYNYLDYKVVDTSINDNAYNVSILFLYGNMADGFYINDEEFTTDIGDFDEPDDYIKAYEEQFEVLNNYDKYTKYAFTFEKINDNFYLRSFRRTN